MATEDIERLKEKIDKDPDSKLFVPLAEEYKKAGMLDEAIAVLSTGLEKQPSYLSARVSLGKIYIEKGMLEEAKSEFDKVVSVIPDNLYAHKKLAEIYKALGEKEKAVIEFNAVLKLNPMDEWAAASIAAIEGEPSQTAETQKEETEDIFPVEELQEAEEEPGEIMTDRDIELSESLSVEEAEEAKEEEEMPLEASLSEEDKELWKAHLETVKGEGDEGVSESSPVGEMAEEAEADGELPEEDSFSFEDIFKESETRPREMPSLSEGESPDQTDSYRSVYDADQFVLQGRYVEAMDAYRAILSEAPDDKHVLQRVEELKALLKLLGKDKEELVQKLEAFLEGLKKRRDEFSGST
jgi:tetratricopeptide (TPR) repeat protein